MRNLGIATVLAAGLLGAVSPPEDGPMLWRAPVKRGRKGVAKLRARRKVRNRMAKQSRARNRK